MHEGLGRVLFAAVLIAIGVWASRATPERQIAIETASVIADAGHAFLSGDLPIAAGSGALPDENAHPTRSRLKVLENGVALGPAHSLHVDVRRLGRGRYSHWQGKLLFSASDNSDPRTNGRAYSVGFPQPLPQWIGSLLLVAGIGVLMWGAGPLVGRAVRKHSVAAVTAASCRLRALRPFVPHVALLAALIVLNLSLGFDRSGWILITQPVEASHSANSLLGYSFIRDGAALHKENYSAMQMVALFSGADVLPDMYFRRPVYPFLAAQLAPLAGVVDALVIINLVAWAAGAWICHRFALRFYQDAVAARWAALLSVGGIGFMLHALDLSAHLLSFVFYMGGVLAIHASGVWRGKAPVRTHLALAAYLMAACLQYNTGIALVAAYCLVAVRHNRWLIVGSSAALALAAQPLWDMLVGEIYELRHGTPLASLSSTELQYLQAALRGWADIFGRPAVDMLSAIGLIVVSFVLFESPVVVLVGGGKLVRDANSVPDGRERLRFAWPFIAMPLAAALVFAPAASARGYLVYGVTIFFFAACGAAAASMERRHGRAGLIFGMLLVATTLLWSSAHVFNVLGPAKAYFLGIRQAVGLFGPHGWEAVSLTGNEPVPELFGGGAKLSESGLAALPQTGSGGERNTAYALGASVLFAVLAASVSFFAFRLRLRVAAACGLLLWLVPAVGGRWTDVDNRIAQIDRVYGVPSGALLTYRVELSDQLRRRLLLAIDAGQSVVLFHLATAQPDILISGRPIDGKPGVRTRNIVLDTSQLRRALAGTEHASIELTFHGCAGAAIGGWQRVGLPGRSLRMQGGGQQPVVLPAVELRVVRDPLEMNPTLVAF